MTILCPECQRPLEDDEALLCLYCGAPLRRSIGFFGRLRYPRKKMILIGGILALIAVFLFLVSSS